MLMSLLIAAEDAAAHGGEHADVFAPQNWLPGVTSLAVFLIAFLFLWWKVWPMIVKGLDDRDRKIRDEIKSAEEAREQAKAALHEYEQNLAEARTEANQMITKAKQDAKAVAEQLREQNHRELEEMRRRATRDIESAKQNALSELHSHTAALASQVAGKILQREVSAEDQQRLVEESLAELNQVQRN